MSRTIKHPATVRRDKNIKQLKALVDKYDIPDKSNVLTKIKKEQ